MTAQPITGLRSDAIAACYAPDNHWLGNQCYPNMLCTSQSWAWESMVSQHAMQFNTPYKRACKSSER